MSPPEPPADLSDSARLRWTGLAADVAVTCGGASVDYTLLADLLRAEDRLEQVRAALAADGLTISGSKGQVRPHPLLVTESVLRREVAQGYDRLNLSPKERATRRGSLRVRDDGRLEERS